MRTYYVAIAFAWAAAGFRVWFSWRRPAQPWRWAFTIAMVLAAAGFTSRVWRYEINFFFQISGIGGLVSTLLLIGAGLALQLYIQALRHVRPDPVTIRRRVAMAAIAVAIVTGAWALSPAHGVPGGKAFLDLTGNTSWLASELAFRAWLVITLLDTAVLCLQQARKNQAFDGAGRAGVALIGLGCALATISITAGALSCIHTWIHGDIWYAIIRPVQGVTPTAVICISLGVILTGLGFYWERLRRARQNSQRLNHLWSALVRLTPEVVLQRPRWTLHPLSAAELDAERKRIEIRDSLELLRVTPQAAGKDLAQILPTLDSPTDPGLVRHDDPAASDEPASRLLVGGATMEGLLSLARATEAAAR